MSCVIMPHMFNEAHRKIENDLIAKQALEDINLFDKLILGLNIVGEDPDQIAKELSMPTEKVIKDLEAIKLQVFLANLSSEEQVSLEEALGGGS